jgi:primosomal protein N' (replication factor Y)
MKDKIPSFCETCHSHEIVGMGSGTESLEEDLGRVLPAARIARLDRDVITSQTRLESVLQDFRDLKFNVLVGTQMLVKGHDFPKVTCVVVISVDAILKFPDFRASERALQTLVQVSGRAGRAELPGQVLLQGYDLDHPVLKVIQGEVTVDEFRHSELELRQALHYPPFSRMVRFRFSSDQERELKKAVEKIADVVRHQYQEERWLGPSEALLFRANRQYRYDLYFKAPRAEDLFRASQSVKKLAQEAQVDLVVDVDPYNS